MKKTILGMLILLSVLSACGLGSAKVERAYLSTDQNGVNRTDTFERDSIFYVIVELKHGADDSELKAIWTLLESGGEAVNTRLDETVIKTGSGKITFSLDNETDWQGGNYRVEIYLNGEKEETFDFSVPEPDVNVFG